MKLFCLATIFVLLEAGGSLSYSVEPTEEEGAVEPIRSNRGMKKPDSVKQRSPSEKKPISPKPLTKSNLPTSPKTIILVLLGPCNAADGFDGNPCNNNGDGDAFCNPDYSFGSFSCSCSAGYEFVYPSCSATLITASTTSTTTVSEACSSACGENQACILGSCECLEDFVPDGNGNCSPASSSTTVTTPTTATDLCSPPCGENQVCSLGTCDCLPDFYLDENGKCNPAISTTPMTTTTSTEFPEFCFRLTCRENEACRQGSCVCLTELGFYRDEEGYCKPITTTTTSTTGLPDFCATMNCGENQVCYDGACTCVSGFYPSADGSCIVEPCTAADEVDSNPCNNAGDAGAVCASGYSFHSFSCYCSDGYEFVYPSCSVASTTMSTTSTTELPDLCATISCGENQVCYDGICTCVSGFYPSADGKCNADPCVTADGYDANPCNNNGDYGSTCLPDYFTSTFTCSCSKGWVLSGGVCIDPCFGVSCGSGGFCLLGTCKCNDGYFFYQGKCLQDPCKATDSLDGNPCNNYGNRGASCISDQSTNSYTCLCSQGWLASSGTCVDKCTLSDSYDANPCNDLGDSDALCFMGKKGSYSCSCSEGWIFTGKSCAGACALADTSDGNPCNNDGDSCGTCLISGDSYQCSCSPGFTSYDGMCVDINECDRPYICNDCGSCRNTAGGYYCVCGEGYRTTEDGKGCESLLTIWLNILGVHK